MRWQARNIALAWDLAVILCSGMVAYFLRHIQAPPEYQAAVSHSYLIAAGISGLLVWWLLGINRRSFRYATHTDAYLLGMVAFTAPIVGLSASFLFDRGADLPRSLIMLHALTIVGGLFGARVIGRWVTYKGAANEDISSGPMSASNILLIGDGSGIAGYVKALDAIPSHRALIAEAFVTDPYLHGVTIRGQRVSRVTEQLWPRIADPSLANVIDRIVVATNPWMVSAPLRQALAETTIPVSFFGTSRDAFEQDGAQPRLTPSRDQVSLRARRYLPWKRAIDIVVSVIGLTLAAVPLLLAAFAVRLFLGSPVVFWQWRPGYEGQSIKVLKLRSMREPIDSKGRRLTDEERLGVFGKFLRRSRLDELPQLGSILMGEMSLIGPRPLIHQQQRPDSKRLLVRPGLTGWAQVNGGQLLSEADKEKLDCWYVDNLSFLLDLKILLMTVRVVLLGDTLPEGMTSKSNPLAGDELFSEQAQPNRNSRESGQ